MKKLFLLFMICVSTFVNAQEKETDNFKKTDEVLSEVVKKALLVAEKTGTFVIEQSPLILQEFYNWHICESILGISLWFLISIVLIIIAFKIKNKEYFDFSDIDDFMPILIICIFLVFSIGFLCSYVYDLVFILVAPKLYLIEYFIK
jgi:hypothetical protein